MWKKQLYLAAMLLALGACANSTGPANPSVVASMEQQENEQGGTGDVHGRQPGTAFEK